MSSDEYPSFQSLPPSFGEDFSEQPAWSCGVLVSDQCQNLQEGVDVAAHAAAQGGHCEPENLSEGKRVEAKGEERELRGEFACLLLPYARCMRAGSSHVIEPN